MELISNLISEAKKVNTGISRISYNYDLSIAKKVWFELLKEIVVEPIVKDDNKELWTELIKYTFADKSCKYNLTRGIGIAGKTGSGKTLTMKIFDRFISIDKIKYVRNNQICNFNFNTVSARNIVSEFAKNGHEAIEKYAKYNILNIDDFGSINDDVKHYGTKADVIPNIIEERYSNGLITHFTSNIDMGAIKEKYGERVFSRLMETVNFILLNDKDFRL